MTQNTSTKDQHTRQEALLLAGLSDPRRWPEMFQSPENIFMKWKILGINHLPFNIYQHFPAGALESNTIKKKICSAAPPMGSPLIVPGKAVITQNEATKVDLETEQGGLHHQETVWASTDAL